jgi:biopolymer transport protein ExbB
MHAYGLPHLWQQGDIATRAIAMILLAMSILSWSMIVAKALEFSRVRRLAIRAEQQFWSADDFDAGLRGLGEPGTPLHDLARAGQAAIALHDANRGRLQDRVDPSDWLLRNLKSSIDESASRLQRGLAVLASIGSTAPFVGLIGTVWGIYHALLMLGTSRQASIDQVAGPVGEALIMTAFGLFVAIPAVLGYNGLTRLNRDIVATLNRFAHALHSLLLTGTTPACASRTTTPQPLRTANAR